MIKRLSIIIVIISLLITGCLKTMYIKINGDDYVTPTFVLSDFFYLSEFAIYKFDQDRVDRENPVWLITSPKLEHKIRAKYIKLGVVPEGFIEWYRGENLAPNVEYLVEVTGEGVIGSSIFKIIKENDTYKIKEKK